MKGTISRLSEQFKVLFAIHKGERRGFLLLVLLLSASLVWALFQRRHGHTSEEDLAALRAEHQRWVELRTPKAGVGTEGITPFPFDPNTLNREGWLSLGLTERQAEAIERYRVKGGQFRSKQQLARFRGVPEATLARILPYAQLPDSLHRGRSPQDRRAGTAAASLFAFDPNTLQREGWLALGLSERQADAILRYRAKGGWFRSREHLARFRGVPEAIMARILPFAQFPDTVNGGAFSGRQGSTRMDGTNGAARAFRKLEVNSADSTALVALPGVGPAFARGIIAYREKLGGYRSLDQLAEVRVLQDKPDALERLRELLVVDTLMIRRLNLNSSSVEELAAHPYVQWRLAKPLVALRSQHGPFRAVEDIRKSHLIDEVVFRKLAPYLTVE